MSECEFFQIESETTTRRTRGLSNPDGGGIKTIEYCWCEYPQNTAYDHEGAKKVAGGLMCGGNYVSCPVGYTGKPYQRSNPPLNNRQPS